MAMTIEPLTIEQAARNLAGFIFGGGRGPLHTEEKDRLWSSLSDEFKADLIAFVTKWPPLDKGQKSVWKDGFRRRPGT